MAGDSLILIHCSELRLYESGPLSINVTTEKEHQRWCRQRSSPNPR